MRRTASFKFRGAINKILSLTEEELDGGVVSASTGNYALAVAEAMRIRGRRATIYVGRDIESSRLELLRAHGLDLVVFDRDAWAAEKEARRVADDEGKIYVSPYNDPVIVGGQGTCGYEISQQLPDVDAAFFACGAGGLLTGSAGGVDLDSVTLELCLRYVDEIILLTEDEIAASIRLLFQQHRLVVEGSGALSVGALLKMKDQFKRKKVVAVVCGRNINLDVFRGIIETAGIDQ